jgi:hypothetical protein
MGERQLVAPQRLVDHARHAGPQGDDLCRGGPDLVQTVRVGAARRDDDASVLLVCRQEGVDVAAVEGVRDDRVQRIRCAGSRADRVVGHCCSFPERSDHHFIVRTGG